MDVNDAIDEERTIIEESRNMPKWLVQTLRDNKLATPFPSHTRSGSHQSSYTHDSYAFAVLSMCNEEQPILFDEAHSSENWLVAMRTRYDSIVKNDTWYLIDLPSGQKSKWYQLGL